MQLADHLAGAEVQRGEEARGAVALVVVGGALGRPGPHRQDRLGAIERLDLALLIDAQHDGALGRVEVQTDDVADLLHELRILGELELSRRDAAAARTPARCVTPRLREPASRGHRPRRPMRRVIGRRLQRPGDHRLDLLVGDRRGRPGRGSSSSPSRPRSRTAPATCPRSRMHPELIGHLIVSRAGAQPTRSAHATPAPERSCADATTPPDPACVPRQSSRLQLETDSA